MRRRHIKLPLLFEPDLKEQGESGRRGVAATCSTRNGLPVSRASSFKLLRPMTGHHEKGFQSMKVGDWMLKLISMQKLEEGKLMDLKLVCNQIE